MQKPRSIVDVANAIVFNSPDPHDVATLAQLTLYVDVLQQLLYSIVSTPTKLSN